MQDELSKGQSTKDPKDLVVVATPKNVPSIPDKFTRKDPSFVDGGAPGQIFKFERWGLKYGTDDKGHAAAIILSVLVVILLGAVFVGGLFVERAWIPDALKMLGTTFTFVAGVAIGKSSSRK